MENNKAQGTGVLFFGLNCYIIGEFEENQLIEIKECNCPDKNVSFCESQLYLELNIEKYYTNKNVDWNKTLSNEIYNKNSSFLKILLFLYYGLYIEFFKIK